MTTSRLPAIDEDLIRRLPLPLAQLYRRAHNAKTAFEQHQTAYYLWEATVKLLASAAISEYAALEDHDPQLAERLQNLARPSIGHWWEFVRRLTPILADRGDDGFIAIRDLVLGRARDGLPRTAGLDALLRKAFDDQSGARTTVRLTELFDRLVRYRNEVFGHAAVGLRSDAFYAEMAPALLAGLTEMLSRVDPLAGRRLLYVDDVRRMPDGNWLVERYELIGEVQRRLESLEIPDVQAADFYRPPRVYLLREAKDREGEPTSGQGAIRALHPLIVYESESGKVFFLNCRRGEKHGQYLCYTTGEIVKRDSLIDDQCAFLGGVFGVPVEPTQINDWQTRSQAEEPTIDQAKAPPPQRTLGEFELLSRLGKGGMGIVYRAWQPSLGRQVALKALLRVGNPKTDARFAREIRALGRVDHPNLVRVFSSGSEGDRWFYAMELVEGADLAGVCDELTASPAGELTETGWKSAVSTACEKQRQKEESLSADGAPASALKAAAALSNGQDGPAVGRAPIEQIVELVQQVADAAHALHGAGVIHRDIKPGNIMVTPDGRRAVLMDLGLAQLADDTDGRLTRTRQFVGTLRYASPEQVLAVGDLDPRTDVYSLGATLWELLTLKPLFGATEATPSPELMRRIQFSEVESARRSNPKTPKDLDAIVQKCLEKDRSRRYTTARELSEELQQFLDGEPVLARPVRGIERRWRWIRRNRTVSSLLAVIVLSLVTGAIVAIMFAFRANQQALNVERQLYAIQIGAAQRAIEAGDAQSARTILDASQVKFRGWEYDYLHSLVDKMARAPDALRSLAVSIDGRQVASGSRDGTIKVWNADDGKETITLKAHAAAVLSVAFSPDGKRIVDGSHDATVKVWDSASGLHFRTLKGHGEAVTSVAFSPDGKWIATGSDDATIKLWDASDGQEILTLEGHAQGVTCLAFSPNGKQIATGSRDKTVKLWDPSGGQSTLTLEGHAQGVTCIAFSPDGKRIATGSRDKTVNLWDAFSGQSTLTLEGDAQDVTCIAFSSDGKRIVTGSSDKTINVWDAASGLAVVTIKKQKSAVCSMAFSPDGKRIFSGSTADGSVTVWNATTGREVLMLRGRAGNRQEPLTLKGHTTAVTSVEFSPDGEELGSVSINGNVKAWDVASGQESSILEVNKRFLARLAFSPDGKLRIVDVSRDPFWDNTVELCDAASGQEVLTLKVHSPWARMVSCIAFSPDSKRVIASLGSEGLDEHRAHDMIEVWDAASGREVLTLKGHSAYGSVSFSPDGTRIVGTAGSDLISIWDAASGQEILTLKPEHSPYVSGVAFSPDDKRIAMGSSGTTKVWDAASGREILTLAGHIGRVNSVTFSPDGKRIATGGEDKTVKIWDVASGHEILSLKGDSNEVASLAFSPDGERVGGGYGNAVKVWNATSGQEILSFKGTGNVFSLAFSSDGRRISGSSGNKFKVWDAATGQEIRTVTRQRRDNEGAFAFSPDGKRIARGHRDRLWKEETIKFWEGASQGAAIAFRGSTSAVGSVALSPDGKWIAIGRDPSTREEPTTAIKIWDATNGQEALSLKGTSSVSSLAFSPDSKRIASGGDVYVGGKLENTIKIWDAASGGEILTLKGHGKYVTSQAFSPDGKRIVSPSGDGTIKVWDASDGQEILALKGHTGVVYCVAFSPDGRRIASGSGDKTIKIWDAASGQEVLTLRGHADSVLTVAFSPNGKRLASGNLDTTIKVFDASGYEVDSWATATGGL